METVLIVNPVSGSDEASDHVHVLEARLREAFGDCRVELTDAEGHGEDLARRAAERGCGLVVVAGGDGTLNEALNGVASVDALHRVIFGVVPMGTGNDFASLLDLPADPEEAVSRVAAGRERRVDVGVVNGRAFVNASGGGFLAEVSDALTPGMKTVAGRFAYLIAGAGVLPGFDPPVATVVIGGERLSPRQYHLFVVCNGQTIGGGHRVAPLARLDDGLLDVCLVEASGPLDLLALLRRLSKGEHLDDERVTFRQFQTAEFVFDRVVKVNTDGEVRESRVCQYTVMPGAARFYA